MAVSRTAIARRPTLRERTGLTPGAVAAIATTVAVGTAASLLPPLLSLTLTGRGVSERTVGMLISVIALASLTIAPFAARIAARFGTAPTIAVATLVMASLVAVTHFIGDVRLLFPVAYAYGIATSLCFTLSEYWINAATPENRRGMVIGIYASMLSIGFAVGPAIIAVLGIGSVVPYLVGALILVGASVPVLLARRHSPDFHEVPRARFVSFILAVPVATIGAFVFAMGEGGGFAFLPVWGAKLGFSEHIVPLLASAMTLGNVIFQVPIGMLADRVDRRLVLFVLGVVGCVGMVLAWAVSGSPSLLMLVLFLWGGSTAGIYTVGLSHLAGRFRGGALASANAAFIFCYALGMFVGPVIIGDGLARAPVAGFPLVLGTVFLLYAVLVAFRLWQRP
ncbi:MFS transporter [Propylenella binzhouense]|uniref:MFS transporter n=1 Tax=Propylenella binzhouense TaxID=2555902 RepID=A0A964T1G0_9HYPH|nr:MFS transporter [Propylenella binzhouense]MYZ46676.1 MFS transporter [Propylenella binzhouense]